MTAAIAPRERVKYWRKIRGYSQEELGRRASMDQSKISRIESDETTLSAEDLEQIVAALGLTMPEFYGATDEAKAS